MPRPKLSPAVKAARLGKRLGENLAAMMQSQTYRLGPKMGLTAEDVEGLQNVAALVLTQQQQDELAAIIRSAAASQALAFNRGDKLHKVLVDMAEFVELLPDGQLPPVEVITAWDYRQPEAVGVLVARHAAGFEKLSRGLPLTDGERKAIVKELKAAAMPNPKPRKGRDKADSENLRRLVSGGLGIYRQAGGKVTVTKRPIDGQRVSAAISFCKQLAQLAGFTRHAVGHVGRLVEEMRSVKRES